MARQSRRRRRRAAEIHHLGVSINLGAPLVNQIVVSAIGAIVLVLVARVIS
jgi:hypothetical protein